MSFDFQLARSDPFNEFVDAGFDLSAVRAIFKLSQHIFANLLFCRRVRLEAQFALLSSLLQEFVRSAIGMHTHENANLLNVFQGGVQFVKTADKKIADEAIEIACAVPKQHTK